MYGALGIALGLGLLVGLQRERVDESAGIRTFPLITVLGAVCALLTAQVGAWLVPAGLVSVAAVVFAGKMIEAKRGPADAGVTTDVAALVMFAVGAACGLGHEGVALVVGGAVAVLLHAKQPLHDLAHRIGPADAKAITRFALIVLVILPVLPNRGYGPYAVLNPFEIWLMVALIVGMSIAAYVAFKLLGARVGALLSGVLGGLISSTATTVSYARRARTAPDERGVCAVVVVIASATVFGRVLVELAVVAPGILGVVAPPIAAMMGFMVLVSAVLFLCTKTTQAGSLTREPPSDFRTAIAFGLVYAAVLFAVAFAKEHFGSRGLFVVAALSGLTDMDAITLSTAQLARSGALHADTAWRLIVVGAMANLVFKLATVAVLGSPRLLGRVAIAFGAAIAAGVALLWWWPVR